LAFSQNCGSLRLEVLYRQLSMLLYLVGNYIPCLQHKGNSKHQWQYNKQHILPELTFIALKIPQRATIYSDTHTCHLSFDYIKIAKIDVQKPLCLLYIIQANFARKNLLLPNKLGSSK
jgi:hypothetical protein